ncbi:hypothetical protein KIN20_006749 [Parelaphostrongylus tenuis]|uniref:Uncharacterized protein n=1 Tax=Parelaphostrongylus tenuis TaxID=148309 RepID=A0AAD5M6J3_PARTN|nr:hypothetical protein KIN20_006749 [Parelaphostrongylus tenuis]
MFSGSTRDNHAFPSHRHHRIVIVVVVIAVVGRHHRRRRRFFLHTCYFVRSSVKVSAAMSSSCMVMTHPISIAASIDQYFPLKHFCTEKKSKSSAFISVLVHLDHYSQAVPGLAKDCHSEYTPDW